MLETPSNSEKETRKTLVRENSQQERSAFLTFFGDGLQNLKHQIEEMKESHYLQGMARVTCNGHPEP
jgi:hypothetical protein